MNKVIEHLGSKYPIIQAPMGWIARSQLASAVSNAGGFGVIETSSGEVDTCKEEIKKMKLKFYLGYQTKLNLKYILTIIYCILIFINL